MIYNEQWYIYIYIMNNVVSWYIMIMIYNDIHTLIHNDIQWYDMIYAIYNAIKERN